ncbi:septal ring lytic transglycosylase RlpA family protein [Oscillatoria sp. FACHB-1406]|uniref:septal ring lytic transglycosylase RlpA family protein n=1 Tax=Oscillatoria sp. FACHB-1406 TaxID=2692846 RepID=UPI001683A297|nr:septal ring lytic transglycosylase RlpA family protein [Oscillatoria sp. FACHB-1406]MBD2580046.1 septal ring lytic transglycosylase RlpA family protein [Oscillatoria sp. FACHB-1406]
MPLFRIAWVTSCLSILLAYSQSLLKLPNYFSAADARSLEISLASASAAPLATSPVTAPAMTGLHERFTETLERNLAFNSNSQNPRVLPLDSSTCTPLTEQQKGAVPVAALPRRTLPEAIPPQNVSQRLGKFMQNLLAFGRKAAEGEAKPAKALAIEVTVNPVSLHPSPTALEWGQSEPRAVPVSTIAAVETQAAPPSEAEQAYQVRVNGRAIAQLNEQRQADLIAERLERAISQTDFDAKTIKPVLSGKIPGAMMGKTLLFAIDDRIASKNESNRDLLAINWTNNLRAALGVPPLTLLEAQQQMYNVVETSKTIEGFASWYGGFFHGRLTANGETYNKHAFTAAHPSLPFDTYLKVTNLKNNDSAIVRINDRGPFIAPRTLDLSWGVSKCIGSEKIGVIPYKAVVMKSSSPAR